MVAVGIPGAIPFGGHAGPVYCVAFSPDGTAFATGGEDGVVRLWDTATRRQTRQLTGHIGIVHALSWNPDGATIASGGGDTDIRLWEVGTGQSRQLTRHNHTVRAVAWNPDGTILASGAGSIRLWDGATGEQTRHISGHSHQVDALAWHPDGTTLASSAHSVRLWDTGSGQQIRQLTGHTHRVRAVAWHPDGTILASGAMSVRLWDAAAWTQTQQIEVSRTGELSEVTAIAWNRDGTIVAASAGTSVLLREPAGGETRWLARHAGRVSAIAWSPAADSTIASAGGDDCAVLLWDTGSGQETHRLTGHVGGIEEIAWKTDGTILATSGNDASARLWDASTGQQIRQFTEHPNTVSCVAWNPSGTILAIGADGVQLWDAATWTQTQQITVGNGYVPAIAWHPAGTAIATWAEFGDVGLWDVSTAQRTGRLTIPRNAGISGIAWSPDGSTLATISFENETALLWDAATGRQSRELTGHNSPVLGVAWSPDGSTLATVTWGATIRLWDPATGHQTRQLTGHGGPITAVAWHPDGSAIATASWDTTVRLWDPATGQQIRELTGHTRAVNALAWHPDGTTLASVGADGTIRIWNPRSGQQISGSGFGVARVPTRPLAGVRSDSASDTDLLGVGEDVETLAELIAAIETRPPLAIALIGDWGAGKSSVLLQMEKHVRTLADRARNNPGLTAWAETVRQVRFNAWHYSDDKLWAGLVTHLFEVLAAPASPEEGKAVADPRSVARDRTRLKAELRGKERAKDRLDRDVKAAEAVSRPAGSLGWVVSPWYAARTLIAAARQGIADLRASLVAVLGAALLAAGAYAAWHYLHGWIASVLTAIAVLVPPVTLAFGRTRAFIDRQRASLAARQQEYEWDIKSLSDQLVLVDAAERLSRFLGDRGGDGAYLQYQGLLGQVRQDLDQLSAKLAEARGQWEGDGHVGPPPLERIVLYIDDLDRCPPRRVVEVLEAVHLMLALDLFVVVVAVDARWLIQSLEYHHRDLFEQRDGRGDGRDGARGESPATPIDYLDKIFQIPFTLLPPAPEATAGYLRSLLPAVATLARPASRHDRGAAVAGPEADANEDRADADADGAGSIPHSAARRGSVHRDLAAGGFGADPDDLDAANPAGTGSAIRAATERLSASELERLGRLASGDPSGVLREFQPGNALGADRLEAAVNGIELRPLGLQVSQAEVEFMARLGGLLPTPRAAKRLVNIYRLVRIGIPRAELAEFVGDETGGPYQAVQILLAILVGQPGTAKEVFRAILEGTHGGDLATVVADVGGGGGETHPFGMIHDFLMEMRRDTGVTVSSSDCRAWCPRLARFSFYTRELVAGASRELSQRGSRPARLLPAAGQAAWLGPYLRAQEQASAVIAPTAQLTSNRHEAGPTLGQRRLHAAAIGARWATRSTLTCLKSRARPCSGS